jgi:soluble lytic murein transglycosylase-like protein
VSARKTLGSIAVSLALTLSCSVRGPQDSAASSAPAQREAAAGPSAVEFVQARFHDRLANLSPLEIRQVSEAIVAEADQNGVAWELVLAVIATESGFQNFAVSTVGALGLMQIMPHTGKILAAELDIPWNGNDTLFQPLVNVKMGTRYLAYLHGRYDDWDKALAAYNWGPGRIDWKLRNGRVLPVEYVNKVMARVQSPLSP